MNRKIIDIDDPSNIVKFIVGAPRETIRSTADIKEYISEVWFKDDDGKLHVPIIQPPRLKVKYGVKQYSSYCVSMHNYDIDTEIANFLKFVQAFDRHIVSLYTAKRATWGLEGIKNKYWTAMRRKDKAEDYYFVVKLIHEKGAVLTLINDNKRKVRRPADITYGCYVDQYISPTYILYSSDGMHPIWNAHQVVISDLEKVFLENCLLDHLYGDSSTPPMMLAPCPRLGRPACLSLTPEYGRPGQVHKSDLLDAIKKLKRSKTEATVARRPPCLITAEALQMKKQEIMDNARSQIMHESIKHVPVEGGTVLPRRIKISKQFS